MSFDLQKGETWLLPKVFAGIGIIVGTVEVTDAGYSECMAGGQQIMDSGSQDCRMEIKRSTTVPRTK